MANTKERQFQFDENHNSGPKAYRLLRAQLSIHGPYWKYCCLGSFKFRILIFFIPSSSIAGWGRKKDNPLPVLIFPHNF